MGTTITMTSREQRRAWVLTRVLKRELTMTEGADMVALSERQLWRLRVAFERDGPAGLVYGNRGRPSKRRLDGSLRARVIDLRQTTYLDVNDTHLAELIAEREGIAISRPSLQRSCGQRGWLGSRPRRQAARGEERLWATGPASALGVKVSAMIARLWCVTRPRHAPSVAPGSMLGDVPAEADGAPTGARVVLAGSGPPLCR
jgi:hypothetical protein